MFARLMGRRLKSKNIRPDKNGVAVAVTVTPTAKDMDVSPSAEMDTVVCDATTPMEDSNVVMKDDFSDQKEEHNCADGLQQESVEESPQQEPTAAVNHDDPKEEQSVMVAEMPLIPQTSENGVVVVENGSDDSPTTHINYIGDLPLLQDVPWFDRQELLIKKLNLCCQLYDFSNSKDNAFDKEIKRQTLMELLDYIQYGGGKLTERVQGEITKMFATNLFRSFPPASHESINSEKLDKEEEDPCMDPSWPHLQIVYELLLRYIVSSETDPRLAKRYIDRFFVQHLLDLFDSEDPREREYAKTILHRIYGKYMMHRPFIRRAMGNIFYRFIYETEKHSGISELLEILGSIINGFALPLKEEHKLFLSKILMPLHKPKCLALYHQQLSYCVTQYVEKDVKLVDVVVKGLLKYWPITNSQKSIMFLGELEEVLEITQSAEFQCCMVPLFRQISRCLTCSHFQVAERALFFWSNDHIANLIAENRNVILPLIFEALEKNTASHWHQAVHGLTANVRRVFLEMDESLFKECQLKFQEDEVKAKESQQRRVAIWRALEEMASSSDTEEKQVELMQN